MKRMGMLRIVFVWITVTWCLLVPAIAQNVVDTRLLSESSKSDSANGNLRSSRQNKEEKTKEAPKKYSSSDEDFARTLTFNLPTIPPGQRTFNFPANRRPAGGVLSSPGKRPPDGPRGDGKKDEPCRTLPCLYLANNPRPPRRPVYKRPIPLVPPSPAPVFSKNDADMPSSSPTSSPTPSLAAPSSPASSSAAPFSSVAPSSVIQIGGGTETSAPSAASAAPSASVSPSSVTQIRGGTETSTPSAETLTGYETPTSSPDVSPALSPASSPNLELSAGSPSSPIASPIADDSTGAPTGNYVGTPQPFSNKLPVSIPPTPPPSVGTLTGYETPTSSPDASLAPSPAPSPNLGLSAGSPSSPIASPIADDSAGAPLGNYVGTPQPFSNKLPVSIPPTPPPVDVNPAGTQPKPNTPSISASAPFAPIQSPAATPVGEDFLDPL